LSHPSYHVQKALNIFSPYACGPIPFQPQVTRWASSTAKKKKRQTLSATAHTTSFTNPTSCSKNRKKIPTAPVEKFGRPCTSLTNLRRGVCVRLVVSSDVYGDNKQKKLNVSRKYEKIAEICNFSWDSVPAPLPEKCGNG